MVKVILDLPDVQGVYLREPLGYNGFLIEFFLLDAPHLDNRVGAPSLHSYHIIKVLGVELIYTPSRYVLLVPLPLVVKSGRIVQSEFLRGVVGGVACELALLDGIGMDAKAIGDGKEARAHSLTDNSGPAS